MLVNVTEKKWYKCICAVREIKKGQAMPHALRAFKRVAIKKGETRQVTFQLDDESFEWFDENTNTVYPLSGEYEILYGGSSDRKQLKAVKVKRI